MIKISVAIPIYNAAKHLDVLFDSLRHQTMNAADFEIICVNDCSTDNSKEIIERHREAMPNIVLINYDKNSGNPTIPRNDAINAAQGEYIHFLDNDDFLGEEALERLYNAAKENGSDVIFGRYVSVNGMAPITAIFEKGNLSKADLIADDLLHSLTPHKMFRRAFLRERGFKFDTQANAGNDDQLFLTQCYVSAKVITVMADYPYYFVVARGNENLSSRYVPAERWLYTWHRIMAFLNEAVPDEDYKRRLKIALLNRLLVRTRFRKFLLRSETTREQKIEWLHEAKQFLDAHADEQLLLSLDPRYRVFWQAVKENDVEKLAVASVSLNKKASKPKSIQKTVATKRANVVSYKRPSVNAIQATAYPKSGQVLAVYGSVKGWFETRRLGKDGILYAEFIQQKDVRYTVKYKVRVLTARLKARLLKLK